MIEWLQRIFNPAHAACLAIAMVAVGIEVQEGTLQSVFEIAAAVIAALGWLIGLFGERQEIG